MADDAVDDAYPNTDAQYDDGAIDAYPDTDAQYDDDGAVDAYPNTDAQYDDDGAVDAYPNTDAQYNDDGAVEAYPNTDAQYDDESGAVDAYPDTDAQYGYGAAASRASADNRLSACAGPQPAAAPPPSAPPAACTSSASGVAGTSASSEPPGAPRRWRPPDWSKLPVMHNPRLEAYENGRMARSMSLQGMRSFVIGRNGAQADVVVADASISRAHAVLINSSSATFIQDLESAHGTWYDEQGRTMHIPQLGVRLGPDPVKLVEGGALRFGTLKDTVFRVTGLQPPKVERWQPPAWSSEPSRKLQLEVRSNSVANPYLEHLEQDGGDIDELITLRARCHAFGRSAQHVDTVVRDDSISRQHAAIVHSSEGDSYLVDMGSASGTHVDDERLVKDKPFKLRDGHVITLGTCRTTWTFRVVDTSTTGGSSKGKRKR